MDRNDGIVRWSPNPAHDDFLTVNINYRMAHLQRVMGNVRPDSFEYQRISKHNDFPQLTCYDWSPKIKGLVAVGTPRGEVHLLRVDDDSNASLILPIKLGRSCQSVAFNTTGLLAVGLDRVRNDQCLHIWDVNQRLINWNSSLPGLQGVSGAADPILKLEPSLPITSVRFFEDQPQTLVVGIKNQNVRIHDLRGS